MNTIKKYFGRLNPFNRSKRHQLDRLDIYPEEPENFLCLIVPALALENIRENDTIKRKDMENLIDNSLYFLCTDDDEAHEIWKLLETTDEDYRNVSEQREVYVSIEIDNAEEMVGKKVPYILKRNLPVNAEGEVKKIACLKYLSVSGLEKFNRI